MAKKLIQIPQRNLRRKVIELPGLLTFPDSERAIRCAPLNVSEHGLGIFANELLIVNSELHLLVDTNAIPLIIRWSLPGHSMPHQINVDGSIGDVGLYYGLEVVSREINLESLFESKGVIGTFRNA